MALLRRPERGAPPFSVSGSRDGDGTQYGLYVGVAFIRTCVSSRVTCEGTYTALSTKEQGPQIAQEHRCSVSQRRPPSPWLSLASHHMVKGPGPLSEAGGGEDLVVSVAEERDKVLLALLDLAQRLVVRLAQPLDHGRDSACGVGA